MGPDKVVLKVAHKHPRSTEDRGGLGDNRYRDLQPIPGAREGLRTY